jgi:ribulose-5-phosphate 4-epimerase/fuculose-1-phosphate aldolase
VIGDVAYHSYEGAVTRLDERERILADLGDRHILVLRNHGLLTVGRSIGEAFVATYKMERACQMQLAFQKSGAEFFPIPEAVVQDAYARAKDRFAGDGRNDPAIFEWPALMRKLGRLDPSYKQ